MNLIDFSVTFIFTIVNIIVLFIILRAILFKPVTKFIEARAAGIKTDMENAASDREEAKSLKALYEEKMRSAEVEARRIADEARRIACERSEAIIAEGRAQADAVIASARKQLDAERRAAFLLFKAEAATLVLKAASGLIGREISGEDAKRFCETAIRENVE